MRLIDPPGFYCELFRIFFVSHGRGQSLYLTVGRFYGFPHIKKALFGPCCEKQRRI